MKILNLYCGIGGNRRLWDLNGDTHEITAVEYNKDIANLYKKYFPNDKVIVGDAHEYLLEHFKEFDFIWASPPCPTHSDIRRCSVHAGKVEAKYPEMSLYQEIILLMHFAPKKTKWCIENVKPYYTPLIPAKEIARHLFWTNFDITYKKIEDDRKHDKINGSTTVYGYNLKDEIIADKRKILRNMVDPRVGLHILNEAMGIKDIEVKQQTIF